MATRTRRFLTMLVALTLVTLPMASFSAAPAAAATSVTLYGPDSFESPLDSGWALGSETPLIKTTWGETSNWPAHSGSRSLWCAGTNDWQTARDFYDFTNDEDGPSGPHNPVDHYHGGVKVSVQGVNGTNSSNSYVDLDYFVVRNSYTGQDIRVEDTSSAITYVGTGWETTSSTNYSGGTAHVSKTAGDYAQIYISGSLPVNAEGFANLEHFSIWYVSGHVTTDRGKADVWHAYSSSSTWTWARGVDESLIPPTYSNYQDGAISRDVTLTSDFTSADVSFWYRIPSNDTYASDGGLFDVSTDGGTTWQDGYGFYGYALDWVNRDMSLTKYIPSVGQPPKVVKVRWRWISDNDGVAEGMFIDDVAITAQYDPVAGDSTPPTQPVVTLDGPTTTNLTSIHARWNATDPESGIQKYEYSVGSGAGGADVKDWTDAALNTDGTISVSPRLEPGQDYYVNVRATNGANGLSEVGSSSALHALATSSVTLLRSSAAVTYGSYLTLSGNLNSTSPTSAAIDTTLFTNKVLLQRLSGSTWTTIATRDANASGFYSYAFKPASNATYRATWSGEGIYAGSTSASGATTVRSSLTIYQNLRSFRLGGRVKLYGTLSPTKRYKTVTIQYKSGGLWRKLTTDATDWYSKYLVYWKARYRGTYYIRAYYPADSLNAAGNSRYIKVVVY